MTEAFNPKSYQPPADSFALSKDGKIPDRVLVRRQKRAMKRLGGLAAGGFVWHPVVPNRPNVPVSNIRAERRRLELGRV